MTLHTGNLKPQTNKEFFSLLENINQYLHSIDSSSPTTFLLPESFKENVSRQKEVLSKKLNNYRIYFAHKCTKQDTFICTAREQNICIDVASLGELHSALLANFNSNQIEATGPKTREFLEELILREVLIILDSKEELLRIIAIRDNLPFCPPINVGIRLGSIISKYRNLKQIDSRFGIDSSDLPLVCELIEENNLNLFSINFHSGRISIEERSSLLSSLVDSIIYCMQRGHIIEELNIGGGIREPIFNNPYSWNDYIDELENQLLEGNNRLTWDGSNYGLKLSKDRTVIGRSAAIAKGILETSHNILNKILDTRVFANQSFASFLNEAGIRLAIEPGYSLLHDAACTVFKVVETKKGPNNNYFTILGGCSYDLGTHIRDYLPDPILLDVGCHTPENHPVYLCGLLCKEEDMLINRKILFKKLPAEGDYICFPNTGAYRADFETIDAHMRTTKHKYIAIN